MGPLAQPSLRRPAPAGFTLVEILVVLVILAIGSGVAIVAYDASDRDRASREAHRFAGAIEHAAALAQVRAETLGVSADGRAWRFWRRPAGGDQWLPLSDDDVLSPHTLPAAMTLTPSTYGAVALDLRAIVPLRPTGRNEPFSFVLDARNARVVLAADPLNRIAITVSPR
ncbi:MAG: prepilin-type N-terminal cleavage/methylation domain-containing protein [Burkholderiales bacterium]|nr:prepilin-type N-terminal cleavage/methylation domain-containing protein [Burkholderiales bacterium]